MEAGPVAARRIRVPARPGLTRAASATPGQAPPATSLTYGIPNRVTPLGRRRQMTTASTGSQIGASKTGRVIPGPGYVSKTDMVAALIREQIITGELAAGEQLRQRDLAQRFQVSQTPVREAMRRLESEGLGTGDTHRGFTVVEPDARPGQDDFQIRRAPD